jgi:hypothetical protein
MLAGVLASIIAYTLGDQVGLVGAKPHMVYGVVTAKIYERTDEQKREWGEWVATRPPVVQDLCNRFSPDRLYIKKSTGQRVTLHSFSEEGTLTVDVLGSYNQVIFEMRVFGVHPDDLEECELPGPHYKVGVLTKAEEVKAYIYEIRPAVLKSRGLE